MRMTANVGPADDKVRGEVEELGCKRVDTESHRVHACRVPPKRVIAHSRHIKQHLSREGVDIVELH